MQEIEEMDMQDDDAFLGEVDVDQLIAQHRQKQSSPDIPSRLPIHPAPRIQEGTRQAAMPQSTGNGGQLPLRNEGRADMQGPFCSHGQNFAECPQRFASFPCKSRIYLPKHVLMLVMKAQSLQHLKLLGNKLEA